MMKVFDLPQNTGVVLFIFKIQDKTSDEFFVNFLAQLNFSIGMLVEQGQYLLFYF